MKSFPFIADIFLLFFVFTLLSCGQSNQKPSPNLTEQLEELLSDFKGDAGVYVLNLKTGETAEVNADTLFPTASVVKVPILVGVFKKIVDRELDYHEPLLYRDTMAYGGSGWMQYFKDSVEVDLSVPVTLMMTHSDNTASLWCQELAGGGKEINAWLEGQGYKNTRVNSRTKGRETDWEKYGWGQTTPREMTELLVSIRKNEILTPAATERIYRNMTNIYWDDYALFEVPPYVQAASKQGMVNASRSELVMVNAPHGDYVFYVATKEAEDERWKPDNESWVLAREVSKLLWNYFEPNSEWKPAEDAEDYFNWNDDENVY